MNSKIEEIINLIKKKQDVKEPVNQILDAYYREVDNDEPNYPNELTLPLKERKTGIYEVMKWLVDNGFDMNEGDFDCPLILAVGYADSAMVRFLIQNGADANHWPVDEDEVDYSDSNYYYDDIDTGYMDETFEHTETYVNALLETAKVLCVEGGLGDYSSFCLKIKNGEITIGPMKMKY